MSTNESLEHRKKVAWDLYTLAQEFAKNARELGYRVCDTDTAWDVNADLGAYCRRTNESAYDTMSTYLTTAGQPELLNCQQAWKPSTYEGPLKQYWGEMLLTRDELFKALPADDRVQTAWELGEPTRPPSIAKGSSRPHTPHISPCDTRRMRAHKRMPEEQGHRRRTSQGYYVQKRIAHVARKRQMSRLDARRHSSDR